MTRAYHRIDPLMDERKSHYSPAQLGAFVKVQLVAGRQSERGWFRSVSALQAALPTAYARLVPFLVEEGDLDVKPDGRVYVDGWQEWQEGDLTVAERMARLRNRRRNAGRNGAVTGGVTPAVTQPSPAAIGVGIGTSVDDSTGSQGRRGSPGERASGGRGDPGDPIGELIADPVGTAR